MEIEGFLFQHVCKIIPELNSNGKPKEYTPYLRYNNTKNIPLHKYGRGPFCQFKISKKHYGKMGVYLILVDGKIKYVGECENLVERFNRGYGLISPRNCFVGGQPTNCKINSLILEAYKNGSEIELLFYETSNRFNIESILIKKINPEWNETRSISPLNFEKKESAKGKYSNLEKYLKSSQKQVETLSYDKIEEILRSKLPQSAYKYRAWWANNRSHSQANAWLNAGWKVSSVVLGKFITFRKVKTTRSVKEDSCIPEDQTSKTKPAPENIPKLIKELYQLKREGIITEEEFEEKKKKLLSQL